MNTRGNDFQNYNYIRISSCNNFNHTNIITKNNLIPSCIYLSVRHCIKADWINDRDQFLYPNESWKEDKELHCDCLAFTLFHPQNRITSKDGINHWIPFTETQVNSKGIFKSHFMTDFINGKIKTEDKGLLISENDFYKGDKKIDFSYEALLCFEAGRELYKYYHSFDNINIDASFYDIRAFFQGFKNGRMNSKSEDEKYNALIKNLKEKTDILAKKISYKVYEHGFLKR